MQEDKRMAGSFLGWVLGVATVKLTYELNFGQKSNKTPQQDVFTRKLFFIHALNCFDFRPIEISMSFLDFLYDYYFLDSPPFHIFLFSQFCHMLIKLQDMCAQNHLGYPSRSSWIISQTESPDRKSTGRRSIACSRNIKNNLFDNKRR